MGILHFWGRERPNFAVVVTGKNVLYSLLRINKSPKNVGIFVAFSL